MSERPINVKYRIAFSRAFTFVLLAAILVTESRWEGHPLLSAAIFAAGCVLVAIATIGRLWCALYISGYKSRLLVTVGPYSLSRNPLYLFSLLGGLGVALATETLLLPALVGGVFFLYYPLVIRREEKRLLDAHGEAFADYLRKTPSFWPAFGRWTEPEEYLVNPRLFRKSMIDALWFLWLVGIIEIAEALREAGLLPIVFKSY